MASLFANSDKKGRSERLGKIRRFRVLPVRENDHNYFSMPKKHAFVFMEIPIEKIQMDANQPRTDYGTEGDENRLLVSIRDIGLQVPIKVMKQKDGDGFLIIDGHRRYICAKKLNFKKLPCVVEENLSLGQLELRRYETQNNRRDWKPIERSEAFHRIKESMNYRTNKELAKALRLSESIVADILNLKNLQLRYLSLMMEYDLSQAYQSEFVKLYPKLRKIREFEVDEIILNIFERVKHQVIKTSKDFRRLGRIFKRASANEEEIYTYLKDADMTVSELVGRTEQSGFSGLATDLINQIGKKRKDGQAYTSKEKTILQQLRKLLKEVL